jgi:hypothetical protein
MVKVIIEDKNMPVWDTFAGQYGLFNAVTSPTIDKPTKTIFETTYNPHPGHDVIPPNRCYKVRILEEVVKYYLKDFRFGLTNFLGYVVYNKINGLGPSLGERSSVSNGEDFKTEG